MTAEDFENYKFLRLYSIDLDTTQHTIRVLKRYKRDDVRIPLIREVAVSYGRPFSKNHGEVLDNHTLSKDNVPMWAKGLHRELMRLRNQQFAHTDMKFYNPKVARFGTAERPWFPMAFKGYDYTSLLGQIPEIEILVREVVTNLHNEISRLERSA